jgi:hypothetical protein
LEIAATQRQLEIHKPAPAEPPRSKTPALDCPEENLEVRPLDNSNSIALPPVPARKRGKCMSRRKGQDPKVRVGKQADGAKYYFFQDWVDVSGKEERKRQTEVIGLVGQMTKSEAERKKLEIISKLNINSGDYRLFSSKTFADAWLTIGRNTPPVIFETRRSQLRMAVSRTISKRIGTACR